MLRTLVLACGFLAALGYSQTPPSAPLEQKVGPYLISLRLPADGLYSAEEMQIEFHIADTTKEDPLSGFAPVIRAKIVSEIDMPSMRGMPVIRETSHPEGVPGDYGLHPTFVHGGEYRLRLAIEPPGAAAFQAEFRLPVGDARPRRGKVESPYKLKVEKSGKGLVLRVADAAGPIKDFDIVHEKSMHLIIVSKDLRDFAHVHPELKADGSFHLEEIPFQGDLRLFADFAPRGKGAQVLTFPLKVDGKMRAAADRVLQAARLEPVQGAWVAGKTQEVLLAGGVALSELEPYLGAMGHLVMIHEDAETYVHSHPIEDPSRLIFLARPPKAGKYRAWVETQSKGQVYRQSFDVEVKANASR